MVGWENNDDPWGDDPDWLDEDDEDDLRQGSDGRSETALAAAAGAAIGAQHVVLLIDCQQSMFEEIQAEQADSSKAPDTTYFHHSTDNDKDMPANKTTRTNSTRTNSTRTNSTQTNSTRTNSTQTTTAMELALKMADSMLRTKIRTTVTLKQNKRDGIAIVLFNTKVRKPQAPHEQEEKDTDSDSDDDERILAKDGSTVHVLRPLEPPGIHSVNLMRDFLEDDPVFGRNRDIKKEYCDPAKPDGTDWRGVPSLQTALQESLLLFGKAKCVKTAGGRSQTDAKDTKDMKSIWIITNSPTPNGNSANIGQINNVANDVQEHGVEMLVWPLARGKADTDTSFDYRQYYDGIAALRPFQQIFPQRLRSMMDVEEKLKDLAMVWKRPRRTYWCPMLLPDHKSRPKDEANIMIDWYTTIQMQKKPPPVKIDRETKRPTERVTQFVDGDGNIFATFKKASSVEERARPQPGLRRLRQFGQLGDDTVAFPPSDLETIKNSCRATPEFSSLVLLGFKDADSIPFHHGTGVAYFVVPSDDTVAGSIQAFARLHSSMLRKNVVAIGEVLHRTTLQSRLCALFPLREIEEETKTMDGGPAKTARVRPPGMLAIHLPFEDWMRDVEMDGAMKEIVARLNQHSLISDSMPVATQSSNLDIVHPSLITSQQQQSVFASMPIAGNYDDDGLKGYVATEAAVEAAMGLIAKQDLNHRRIGDDFENAGLTEFYSYLESVALEMQLDEDEGDGDGDGAGDSKFQRFDTRIPDAVIRNATSREAQELLSLLPQDVARKPAKPKRKVVEDRSGINWYEAVENDELDTFTSKELQQYLRSVGEKVSGKKSDLIDRVAESVKKIRNSSSTKKSKTVKREIDAT